jgi:hypothetical protein
MQKPMPLSTCPPTHSVPAPTLPPSHPPAFGPQDDVVALVTDDDPAVDAVPFGRPIAATAVARPGAVGARPPSDGVVRIRTPKALSGL